MVGKREPGDVWRTVICPFSLTAPTFAPTLVGVGERVFSTVPPSLTLKAMVSRPLPLHCPSGERFSTEATIVVIWLPESSGEGLQQGGHVSPNRYRVTKEYPPSPFTCRLTAQPPTRRPRPSDDCFSLQQTNIRPSLTSILTHSPNPLTQVHL